MQYHPHRMSALVGCLHQHPQTGRLFLSHGNRSAIHLRASSNRTYSGQSDILARCQEVLPPKQNGVGGSQQFVVSRGLDESGGDDAGGRGGRGRRGLGGAAVGCLQVRFQALVELTHEAGDAHVHRSLGLQWRGIYFSEVNSEIVYSKVYSK